MHRNYDNHTDEKLFLLVKRNDSVAFKSLYDKYWYRLFLSAHKRLRSPEDAEEVVQDLFESLWRNRKKIIIRTSVERYLFSSMRYIVIRKLQRKNRICILPQSEVQNMASSAHQIEETVSVQDLSQKIHQTVNSLPAKCKKVFKLSRFEMKTYKEIAVIMGVSVKTVESHITRALKIIRRDFNQLF